MMQQPIQQGRCQRCIARQCVSPLSKRQIRGQNHGPFLIALGHDLEEQIGFLPTKWQVADFIHDEQARSQYRPVEVFLQPTLPLCRSQLQHQIGRGNEAP